MGVGIEEPKESRPVPESEKYPVEPLEPLLPSRETIEAKRSTANANGANRKTLPRIRTNAANLLE
jgi:hypothetical protein